MKKLINNIVLGDCWDVMRQMPDNAVDLILTDPPYGLGIDGQKLDIRKNPKHSRKQHLYRGWDDAVPPVGYFEEMLRVSKHAIIFGANYFHSKVPDGFKGWIIWDKGQRGLSMSDCEIAWSNFNCPTRIFTYNRCELLKDGTVHPTQKPLALFAELIREYSKPGDIIFDPFIGSGTTGVAAIANNRKFIGVERDPVYAAAAAKRINAEKNNLFYRGE